MERRDGFGWARLRWSAVVSRTVLVSAVAVLVGCGGGAKVPRGTVVNVSERDFTISPVASVSSGDVLLRVHNEGPAQHELIVVRERRGGLPLRSDGVSVNEEALQRDELGSLPPGEPGGVRSLALHLTPGRYVLFCNMEGHYMGGMYTVLAIKS